MTETVYNSRGIANYFIEKAAATGGLDALQVLKLIYISHGYTLGILGKPLIEDDVEAWKYGPVVRRVYSMLPAGSSKITGSIGATEPPKFAKDDHSIVDAVYEKYGHLNGIYLSTLTHRRGSPWEKTWSTYGQDAVIPRELIHAHYKKILDESRNAIAQRRPYSPDVL